MSLIKRANTYRFYPTAEQRQVLARTFGCCRWVYNQALARKTAAYREAGQHLFYSDLSALLPVWKTQTETCWLAEVSSVPLQQSLRHLDRAFVNFFEGRARYPTFKRKHGPQAATYTTSAFRWQAGQLSLARMHGTLAIRWSRPLPDGAIPSTVTVSRDPAGRYFVSLLVEAEIAPLPPASATVGVDPGLYDVVTLSTGEKTGNERFSRKCSGSVPSSRWDWGQGHRVAELFQAAHMVALDLGRFQSLKVIRAEIVVGLPLAQHVVQDDQDTVSHCHHGFLFASPPRNAVKLGGHVIVFGSADRPSHFSQH